MNDDRLLLEMRRWLQEERVALPDAEQASQQIATQLPATRQRRRRWWRLPFRARMPKPPRTADTAEYQPNPIPAMNGHTPTVIGRTQSMLSPVKAITAGVIVAAVGGVFLIAQPFQQQASVPGAEMSEPTEAVEFTANFPWGPETSAGSTQTLASGVTEHIGWAHRTTAGSTSSDPRFDGSLVYTCNSHLYTEEQGRLFDCVFRIENDSGAWQSEPSLELDFGGATYGPFSVFTTVFEGEGDYEGLTAVVEVTETEFDGYDLHGLIVDGSLPPNAEHFEGDGA